MIKLFSVKPIFKYLREVRSELNKVIWPSKKEVVKLTLTVLIISAVVGLYVGGLDFAFTKLLQVLVGK